MRHSRTEPTPGKLDRGVHFDTGASRAGVQFEIVVWGSNLDYCPTLYKSILTLMRWQTNSFQQKWTFHPRF